MCCPYILDVELGWQVSSDIQAKLVQPGQVGVGRFFAGAVTCQHRTTSWLPNLTAPNLPRARKSPCRARADASISEANRSDASPLSPSNKQRTAFANVGNNQLVARFKSVKGKHSNIVLPPRMSPRVRISSVFVSSHPPLGQLFLPLFFSLAALFFWLPLRADSQG